MHARLQSCDWRVFHCVAQWIQKTRTGGGGSCSVEIRQKLSNHMDTREKLLSNAVNTIRWAEWTKYVAYALKVNINNYYAKFQSEHSLVVNEDVECALCIHSQRLQTLSIPNFYLHFVQKFEFKRKCFETKWFQHKCVIEKPNALVRQSKLDTHTERQKRNSMHQHNFTNFSIKSIATFSLHRLSMIVEWHSQRISAFVLMEVAMNVLLALGQVVEHIVTFECMRTYGMAHSTFESSHGLYAEVRADTKSHSPSASEMNWKDKVNGFACRTAHFLAFVWTFVFDAEGDQTRSPVQF